MSGNAELCDRIEFMPQPAYCGLGLPDQDDQSTPTANHGGTVRHGAPAVGTEYVLRLIPERLGLAGRATPGSSIPVPASLSVRLEGADMSAVRRI